MTDDLEQYLIMGEVSLDGNLRPIKGALPIAIEARKKGFKGFILPKENATEAAIVDDLEIIGVETIKEAILHLEGEEIIKPTIQDTRDIFEEEQNQYEADFRRTGKEDVKEMPPLCFGKF